MTRALRCGLLTLLAACSGEVRDAIGPGDAAVTDAEEKVELVASACRTAALLLHASPNRARAFSYVDPLPRSSVEAMERLMRNYRERR